MNTVNNFVFFFFFLFETINNSDIIVEKFQQNKCLVKF